MGMADEVRRMQAAERAAAPPPRPSRDSLIDANWESLLNGINAVAKEVADACVELGVKPDESGLFKRGWRFDVCSKWGAGAGGGNVLLVIILPGGDWRFVNHSWSTGYDRKQNHKYKNLSMSKAREFHKGSLWGDDVNRHTTDAVRSTFREQLGRKTR